jgi:chorismate mutase/prephenate dehydratase
MCSKTTLKYKAAAARFGDSVAYLPVITIPDVISAVEKGQALYGVVPFENSTFGTVVQTIDRLIPTNLKIRAETYLEVTTLFFLQSFFYNTL